MARAKSLTHIGRKGEAVMVDVSAKAATERVAIAEGRVVMRKATLGKIVAGDAKKGDVLGAARLAGILAAKRTAELIPLCHPLPLTFVGVDFSFDEDASRVLITATARCRGQTGVEMEALTAVSLAVEKTLVIGEIRLLSKTGGKSGDWVRP
jgi:cyclic pyranopterin phosphate synthase